MGTAKGSAGLAKLLERKETRMLRWIMIETKRIDKIMTEGVANVSVYFSAGHRYIEFRHNHKTCTSMTET